MARPKDIGTRAETAIVRYARTHGHPQARRLALAGSHDQGDVWLDHGIIVEVKSGHQAETAGDALIRAWWDQTVTERDNHGARVGVLVTKRKGHSGARCGAWTARMDAATLLHLLGVPVPSGGLPVGLVAMSVDSLLAVTTRYTARNRKDQA